MACTIYFLQAVSAVFNLAGPVGRAFDYLLSPKKMGARAVNSNCFFK
jgi:hypothetical protein